ncbi:MAG: nicotinate-nucleotide adenylyltransferase [candidate division WOR-3 bacterium]
MRVGLFGGTFDPIHFGHLRVAEEVREHFDLERIYFIPALIQPLKQHIKVTEAADRLKMVQMAVRGNRFFRVTQAEMRRGGISYSIDTIKLFERRFSELHFLIGLDAFSEIHLWRDYREIFERTHLVILVRPVHKETTPADLFPTDVRPLVKPIDENVYEHASGKRIYFYRVTQLDISSTMIRELARSGSSIKYLVPQAVERFVKRGGLYTG